MPLDSEIIDEVAGDVVVRYSFVADSAGTYAVFLSALEGSVQLLVTDSTHRYTAASLTAGPGSPPLYENGVSIFPTPTLDGVYHISVAAAPPGAHARFRFVVYPVRTPPGLRPARFVMFGA